MKRAGAPGAATAPRPPPEPRSSAGRSPRRLPPPAGTGPPARRMGHVAPSASPALPSPRARPLTGPGAAAQGRPARRGAAGPLPTPGELCGKSPSGVTQGDGAEEGAPAAAGKGAGAARPGAGGQGAGRPKERGGGRASRRGGAGARTPLAARGELAPGPRAPLPLPRPPRQPPRALLRPSPRSPSTAPAPAVAGVPDVTACGGGDWPGAARPPRSLGLAAGGAGPVCFPLSAEPLPGRARPQRCLPGHVLAAAAAGAGVMGRPRPAPRLRLLPLLALLALLAPRARAWDSGDLELFDLVEEVPRNFYDFLGVQQVSEGPGRRPRALRSASPAAPCPGPCRRARASPVTAVPASAEHGWQAPPPPRPAAARPLPAAPGRWARRRPLAFSPGAVTRLLPGQACGCPAPPLRSGRPRAPAAAALGRAPAPSPASSFPLQGPCSPSSTVLGFFVLLAPP